ncbi:hypothetical protein ACIQ7D_27040 [Streptomyces sp. NPDC096310]|uniref:hypothetical protein n=1 Tax=Streptomyces sp. NPDC096310 TaxID=3366082 RepID=UPI0037FCF9F8
MHHREPPGNTHGPTTPHIPADLYDRARATGQPIVVIHTTAPTGRPARAYLFPIVVITTGAIGILGTVAAIIALIDFAARTAALIATTAGPIGIGGLTLKLARPKK